MSLCRVGSPALHPAQFRAAAVAEHRDWACNDGGFRRGWRGQGCDFGCDSTARMQSHASAYRALDVGDFFEVELSRGDDLVFKRLLLSNGMAAYALGGIMATLNHLDDDTVDPRLHRVTPRPGERGSAS